MEPCALKDKGPEATIAAAASGVSCPHCNKPMHRSGGILVHSSTSSLNCYPGQFRIAPREATQ